MNDFGSSCLTMASPLAHTAVATHRNNRQSREPPPRNSGAPKGQTRKAEARRSPPRCCPERNPTCSSRGFPSIPIHPVTEMATSFDRWEKDPFFRAAEEVQESADRCVALPSMPSSASPFRSCWLPRRVFADPVLTSSGFPPICLGLRSLQVGVGV
jgi:hypothetical protein